MEADERQGGEDAADEGCSKVIEDWVTRVEGGNRITWAMLRERKRMPEIDIY